MRLGGRAGSAGPSGAGTAPPTTSSSSPVSPRRWTAAARETSRASRSARCCRWPPSLPRAIRARCRGATPWPPARAGAAARPAARASPCSSRRTRARCTRARGAPCAPSWERCPDPRRAQAVPRRPGRGTGMPRRLCPWGQPAPTTSSFGPRRCRRMPRWRFAPQEARRQSASRPSCLARSRWSARWWSRLQRTGALSAACEVCEQGGRQERPRVLKTSSSRRT
mmetsp:Transcript_82738/g.219283  ORF Transcript_82738/g.219283 Transcript_82738/m.219283 type:complete len:224 (-) Transcript_82738:356-1027(-)